MITIQFGNREFLNEIFPLVKSFFPGEDVVVTDEPVEEAEVRILLLYLPGVIVIQVNGDDGGFREVTVPRNDGDRMETKNECKRAVYRLLSEYTQRELPWGSLTGIRPTKIALSMLMEGRRNVEIAQRMREEYLVGREKTALAIAIANRELHILKDIDYEEGYSLYVGIPFCPSTCLYCSFTSYPISGWEDRIEEYLRALFREIDGVSEMCGHKKLNSIYMGGGTPTTLAPEQMDRLLTRLEERFSYEHLLEFTVEAGRPDSITREKLEVLRRHGISRISVNPQTMNQQTLDVIGRRHTVEQTVEAFYMARELGFDNINMDIIMGLPGEGVAEVTHTLEVLKELDPDNITVHSLAIKRAARLNMFREEYRDLKIENTEEIMNLASRTAQEMGMEPYYLYRQKNMAGNFENVGYAKVDKAGIYNILMMEEMQTIMALGAGSVSKLVIPSQNRIERCGNVKDVPTYIGRIEEMLERKRNLLADGG